MRSVAVQLTPGRATIVRDGTDLATTTRRITDEGDEVTRVDND